MAKSERHNVSSNSTDNNVTKDPTLNVQHLLEAAVSRQDDLRNIESMRLHHDIETEIKHLYEKFKDDDTKYQIQFSGAKDAVGIALIAQEKAVAAALDAAKEATTKSETAMDKRFDLVSEKIDGVTNILNKSSGATGSYVTHEDLNNAIEKLQLSIETQLRPVVNFMQTQSGRGSGQKDMTGWIVSGILLLITVANFLIPYLKAP